MNIIPKEIRDLVKTIRYVKDEHLNDRVAIFEAAVTLVYQCIDVCPKSNEHSAHWNRIKRYNEIKMAQLKTIKCKSKREYIRQCMNYVYYLSKLLKDLDNNRKGLISNGLFNAAALTERIKLLGSSGINASGITLKP